MNPITLIAECVLGNGRVAVIAGSKTTLYRYVGLDDPNYYDVESNLNYFETEFGSKYFDDGPAGWLKIGGGFSTDGKRWEAVPCGDYIVLNNGVDLPMTYRLDEMSVKPIYELREQQIAAVGTIASHAGILCCMDIYQINDDAFASIMAPVPAAVNASQDTDGKVTPQAATLFPGKTPADLIGLTLFWGTGEMRGIRAIDENGYILVDNDVAIAAGPVSLENPAAYDRFTDATKIQRYKWRFFPSMPSKPRRFGATFPVAFDEGGRFGTLSYPVRSIPELITSHAQTSFVFTGIGLGGANLTADILWTYPKITNKILLDTTAQTAQPAFDSKTNEGCFAEAADAANSFAGIFEDLEDDGGGIIKALTLRDQLVIYKETPVLFVASYTGDLTTPFQFQRIQIAEAAARLVFRNTLIAGGGGFYGSYHLYAGENAFYKFDLFTMIPVELPVLQPCQNLFFENAGDPENCFAADNPNTREIFFVYGGADTDKALCYDYAYHTVRTTDIPMTSAAKIRNPADRTYWFLMGMPDGSIKRYGLLNPKDNPIQDSGAVKASLTNGTATADTDIFTTKHVGKSIVFADGTVAAISDFIDAKHVACYVAAGVKVAAMAFKIIPAVYHRDGQPYDSIMRSGLDSFKFPHGEKMFNEYVLSLSSKSLTTPIAVDFMGAVNASEGQVIQSATIPRPDIQNLLKPTLLQYYIGLQLRVSGMNNPVEVAGHILSVQPVASHSFGRRPL